MLCSATGAAAVAATPTAVEGGDPAAYSPRQIVGVLDNYIVGQSAAKKAVAISLRNRWRRREVQDKDLQADIMPKNILMIGPTGVGKTEISRRMAKLTDAPFVKVEATKYTEVGFKGKDVESIIEDLFANARTKARRKLEKERSEEAERMAHDMIFTSLTRAGEEHAELPQDQYMEKFLQGALNNVIVTVELTVQPPEKAKGNNTAPTMELLFGGEKRKHKQLVRKPVVEAFPLAKSEALQKLVDDAQVATLAKTLTEQEGIVFIDEIDKVVCDAASASADVSSLGVQQDLLPLIEGSTVTLKDGTMVDTDCILFICSGAFHVVKPSDMIAELQGRLPVRVELQALNEREFRRILCEPKFNLLRQQRALLATEKIDLEFTDDGIDALAHVTAKVNGLAQNIGARRLHTVIERVVDDYSFNCDKYEGKAVKVDAAVVNEATKALMANVDLAKYLL